MMMKKTRAILVVLTVAVGLCLLLAAGSAEAATIELATYNFTGASGSPTTTDAEVNATAWVANDTVDEKSGYADLGFTTTDNDQAYIRAGSVTGTDQAAALADDDYFSFTISTADAGELVDLTSLDLNMKKTGTSFSGMVYVVVGGVLQDSASVRRHSPRTLDPRAGCDGPAGVETADKTAGVPLEDLRTR